jgi:hypothetical protein
MALFTDGTVSTLEELRAYESEVYDLATTEQIDLTQKLILAQRELGVELTARLFRDDPEQLASVVVTQPLHLWHTFRSLALTYCDALHSHLNDRYTGKWHEYERLAEWASRNLFKTGVGMVDDPLSQPAPPAVRAISGQGEAEMYWVRTSWVNASGEEGRPSEPAVLAAAHWTVPQVVAGEAPRNATGWNIYAGLSLEGCRKQNRLPLSIGTAWQIPITGLTEGSKPGDGQTPTSYVRIQRVFHRG